MKNRIPQIVTVIAIAIIMSMAIPGSFAKYSGTEEYTINISKDIALPDMFEVFLYVANTQQTFTPNKTGYYAIIVKGGDGADGFVRDDSTNTFSVKGGTGGTVAGIYYLNGSDSSTKADTLYIYPGTRGNRPTGSSSGTKGTGGVNAMGICSGGSGNDKLTGSNLGLANSLSNALASGGGGAGSLVYLNGTSTSNILMVAGGGGAAGCQDDGSWAQLGASIKDAHLGGDGGSNISTVTTSYNATGTYTGKTYAGTDSSGGEYGASKWGTAIGYGGSTTAYNSVGSGGATKKISYGLLGTVPAGSGGAGTYFASNGSGGDSDEYGGGGGGGFCGGGAGTGTSINTGAGGGGGGSSFVAAKANNKNVATLSDSIYASMLSDKASVLPTQKTLSDSAYTDAGDGYVIVKWIGETL